MALKSVQHISTLQWNTFSCPHQALFIISIYWQVSEKDTLQLDLSWRDLISKHDLQLTSFWNKWKKNQIKKH